MSRLARVIVPGIAHHVTQRGNRREPIFFEDGDQEIYRDLLAEQARKARVEIWAYCLMPNHVHLVAVPSDEAWSWSSVRAHLAAKDDELVVVAPVLAQVSRFADLLDTGAGDEARFAALRASEGTGRPLGNEDFIRGLERLLGRPLARRSAGRKANELNAQQQKLP